MQGAAQPVNAPPGTPHTGIAQFAPSKGPDGTATGAAAAAATYMIITHMEQYKNFSLEELRVGDYSVGRKTKPAGGGMFGAAAPAATNAFGGSAFGQPPAGGVFGASAPAFGQVSARTVPCNPPSCQSRSDSVLRPLRSPRRMFEPCAVPGSRLWPRLLVGGQTLSAQHLEGRLAPPQRQVVSEASGSPQQRLVRSGLLPQLGLVLLGNLPPLVRLEQPLRPSLLLGA
jgi:hypothetical protein